MRSSTARAPPCLVEAELLPARGTNTITAADVTAGSVTNTATATGEIDGELAPAVDSATVTLVGTEEEEEEETFDPRPQTNAVIERFLYHRLTALLDDDPDRIKFFRRFPGSLWGGGQGGPASPFDVSQSETGNQVAFSTASVR